MKINAWTIHAVTFFLLGPWSWLAFAGGYAIPPQTAPGIGLSNAVTAGTTDPSAVYVNPAALTEIEGNQFMTGGVYIHSSSSVSNSGRKSINKHDDNFIPTMFANYHLPNPDFTVGLGLYVPFGLATSYSETSFTRFGAIRSELRTLFLTPAVAWRVNPSLSAGAGVSFVHSSASFSRALLLGPGAEGRLRLTDTDDAYGYTFGLLYKPHDQIKLGFNYRGRVDLHFDTGKAKVADAFGNVTTSKATGTQIPLPPVISAGIHWQINPTWSAELDYNFTRWKEFKHLRANFSPAALGGALPEILIRQNWKDTSTLRLGITLRWSESLELRGGVILDETPIPSQTLGPSIPGADLLTLNGGLRYTWNDVVVDLGYMASFYKTRRVTNNTLEADNPANPVAPGRDTYRTFQNLVAVHVSYRF